MSHLYPVAVCCRSFKAFALLEAEQSSLESPRYLNLYKVIVPRRALRRGYIEHARTDVPALVTFTVSQRALRAVIP
eukprot:scaffold57224_cov38-Phaeocystis_antarctica.AAC.1